MNAMTVSSTIPKGFRLAYLEVLYNRPSFLRANNTLPQIHYYLLDKELKQVLGHVAFSREENEVVSPHKAPFGGFELSTDVKSEAFLFFVAEVIRLLKENYVRFMQIHLPPEAYLASVDWMVKDLKALGFKEKQKPAHHMISITEEAFEDKIALMERRKLKKARGLDCQFCIEKRDQYAAVYEFIRSQRALKGHQLSMTWDMLKEALKGHKKHYVFCTVRLEGQIIAAAIMVRAHEEVLYYYFPGHHAHFNHLSPMVFLLDGLYRWGRAEGIKSIDLGTSYWANQENKSLVTFKRRIGGVATTGSVLRKALSS